MPISGKTEVRLSNLTEATPIDIIHDFGSRPGVAGQRHEAGKHPIGVIGQNESLAYVTCVLDAGYHQAARVSFEDGLVVAVSLDQLFLMDGGSWRRAYDLVPGQITSNGRIIEDVKIKHEPERCYKLELSGGTTFTLTNGVVLRP